MKISNKIMFLLMGIIVSVNVCAMSELSNKKKENFAEEKEKAELVKIKTIEFPQGVRKVATLNIQEKELFTGKTFSELIENKARKNEKFILARVVTKVGNDFVVHYFDAHSLNKSLFGEYPIIRNIPGALNNPANHEPIRT